MSKNKNYTISASQFDTFVVNTTKKIIASNNELSTLKQAKKDYKQLKRKISPAHFLKTLYDFEKVLDLGFQANIERKKWE